MTESIKLPPNLIKVSDAARLLAVSRGTVHSLIQSGDLNASKISPSKKRKRQHVRITVESFNRFFQKRFGRTLNIAPPQSTPTT